jgi:hypothetical protein
MPMQIRMKPVHPSRFFVRIAVGIFFLAKSLGPRKTSSRRGHLHVPRIRRLVTAARSDD